MLQSLGFADVREGDIFLTPPARAFADGDVQARKVLFAEHLLRYVPLAALIKNVLDERPGHRAPRVRFEQELEDSLSDSAAKDAGYGDQLGPLRRNILLQRSNGVFQPGGRRVLSEPALIGLAAQPLPQVFALLRQFAIQASAQVIIPAVVYRQIEHFDQLAAFKVLGD